MSVLAAHIIRVTHTGVYEDGRPNMASVHLDDLDEGREFQNRKVQVYIPPNQTVDIPFSTRSLLSLDQGDIKGFIERGLITAQFVLRFRKIGDLGGTAGTGTTLRVSGADPNVERVGGTARFVMDNDFEAPVGFLVGERFSVSGLTGAFDDLNSDELVITAIKPGEDLTGVNAAAYTIEVASIGPDIASGQAPASDLMLLDGKITVLLEGAGNVGGNADSDLYGYIGNQFYPLSITGGGSTIIVRDEGVLVDAAAATLNFVGGSITASSAGPGVVDVTVSASGSAVLGWGNNSVGSNTATRYMRWNNTRGTAPTNSSLTEMRVPRAGTIRNLHVRHNNPGGNGNAIVYTLLVNGVASALTASVASTAANGADTTNTVTVSQGDVLQVEVTKAAGIGSQPGPVAVTAEFIT